MNKKFFLAAFASLCVGCGAAGLAACTPEAPEAQEGTIYQTGVETFWVGIGKAYMTFENIEGEQVFNVNVDSGDGYSSWLDGSWEMVEGGSLTLTAEWEAGENATYLADAESGKPKEYALADGVYTIPVKLPSADVIFTLDPVADKVGEGQTPEPEEPCTEHVDEDGDGKCDNCGEEMPEEEQPEEPGEVAMTLTATTAAGQGGKLELYGDSTWVLSISYYQGGEYTRTAAGTYALDAAYNMVLTVTEDEAEVLPEETYTLTCDYATQTYSGTIEVKGIPVVGDLTLNFAPEGSGPEEPCTEHVDEDGDGKCDNCGADMPEEEEPEEPGKALYTSNVVSIYGGMASAHLALEEGGVYNVYVDMGGVSSWASGTWSIKDDVLTLTPSDGSGDIVCPLTDKAYTVHITAIPSAEVDFVIDMDEDSITYTINYMLNDGTGTVYSTAEVKGKPEEAYISAAPAAPERAGWHFAGWHTKAEIADADIVNGVSKYMWFFGQKLSTTGIAKYNAMTEEEKEAHAISDGYMLISSAADKDNSLNLYARWVQEEEISTAEQLKDIGKDLYGAYKLTADIALTGDWEPIGAYFSNYEYYNTEWWTYSFRGTLNGNGHTVSGLKIVSAELNKNYSGEGSVWFDDGVTCDGTAAMFSALAGANIHDITLASPVIEVTYSGDYLYVGTLAAFDMMSTLTNVKVTNCDITATFDESDLTYRTNLFTVVAGLEAGGWTNVVTGCEVSGDIALNATNKVAHGGEIYLGGMLGENYSTMTGCKSDVSLTLNYEDKGTATEDSCITVNVGGLSGSGTSITGCTVNADITVKAVKETGESSVNVGGIVGSQRYMVTSGNTVTAAIVTEGTLLDDENGVLNVGGVGGRIDVYYTLQILAYTPIVEAGAKDNVQNVTIDGTATDVVIDDAVSVIPGCWYIAKGDQPDYGATSNIEAVVEAYGSYLPVDSLQNGIIFIVNSAAQ